MRKGCVGTDVRQGDHMICRVPKKINGLESFAWVEGMVSARTAG